MNILRKWFCSLGSKQELRPQGEVGDFVDEGSQMRLDVRKEEALRRFAGREEVYEQALHSIAADYSNVAVRLRQLIEKRDIEEFRFVVHTLRGVMGSVGVEQIFTTCSQLEELIDTDRAEEVFTLVEELDDLMQRFLLYVDEHTKSRVKEEAVENVSEDFFAVVKDLAPIVRSRRPKECRNVVSRLKKLQSCQPVLSKETGVEQLISCIEGYEFDRALELITHLCGQKNK